MMARVRSLRCVIAMYAMTNVAMIVDSEDFDWDNSVAQNASEEYSHYWWASKRMYAGNEHSKDENKMLNSEIKELRTMGG
mmetsp:Transcript_7594/g.11529  ORF Transcript_7594/g.11529 Transcript_7594/m.11529 type:complete len:80 (+) Transcript_7594:20-259(+)